MVAGARALVAGASGRPSPPWRRALAYWAYQYKRTWRSSLATSFLYPVLYLAAMGVGLGTLVDRHSREVDHVSYLLFIAPGLLAATAMQVGGNESMYPVMGAIKWVRTYFAMLATPLKVADILAGQVAWIAVRLLTVSAVYLAVMAAFGAVRSPLAVLALPAGVATGLSFATPIMAFSATQESDKGFIAIYRFALIPLFLFSGTFFPVARLPGWLQPVAYATPLYHGVSLVRALTLGQAAWANAADAAYLVALALVGYLLARRSFTTRLVT